MNNFICSTKTLTLKKKKGGENAFVLSLFFIFQLCLLQSEERRRNGAEKFETKIMAKNFLHLMKGMNLHIKETQWSSSRINTWETLPENI